MILFLDDWKKYPGAIADTKTTNQSFLRMASVYRASGVKNYYWHLALFDRRLQGIDPHDPNLTQEQIAWIAVECTVNPIYTLREMIRVPSHGSPIPKKFIANRGNLAVIWAYMVHIDVYNIQPRQTGKSASIDCWWVVLLITNAYSFKVQLFTEKEKLRRENVIRLKDIRDLLPSYINATEPGKDMDNHETVTLVGRKNRYITAIGNASTAKARSLGRGMSSGTIQPDEFAYIPNVHISMSVAKGSSTAARADARMNGSPYGNVFTTTAGLPDTVEGAYAYKAVMNAMVWDEKLFDCNDIDDCQVVVKKHSRSLGPSLNVTMSHTQLGLSDQWLEDAIANAEGDPATINRDFFQIWQPGSGHSPLSNDVLKVIRSGVKQPCFTERTREHYFIKWYIQESEVLRIMNSTNTVATLDSGNAVGQDANAVVIMDVRDMSILATCEVTEASLLHYGQWLGNLMVRFPKMTLVPENKSSGQAIIDIVSAVLETAGQDPFKRIFNRVVEERGANPNAFALLTQHGRNRGTEVYDRLKKKMGFMTTASTREFLYSTVLHRATKSTGHRVVDETLSKQLGTLVYKHSRVDHPPGGHDDMVISWLLGHWFVNYATDLRHYGIERGVVLSKVSAEGALLSPEEQAKKDAQQYLRAHIEVKKKELRKKLTPTQYARAERELAILTAKTERDGGEVVSMDELLVEVKEHTHKRASVRDALANLRLRKAV